MTDSERSTWRFRNENGDYYVLRDQVNQYVRERVVELFGTRQHAIDYATELEPEWFPVRVEERVNWYAVPDASNYSRSPTGSPTLREEGLTLYHASWPGAVDELEIIPAGDE